VSDDAGRRTIARFPSLVSPVHCQYFGKVGWAILRAAVSFGALSLVTITNVNISLVIANITE